MNKLTEKECKEALDDIKFLGFLNIPLEALETIENLIKEHFELVEWKKRFDYLPNFTERELHVLNSLYSSTIKNKKCDLCLLKLSVDISYKFEDLKPNMWVYDSLCDECHLIYSAFECDGKRYINVKRFGYLDFEENRFFPLAKANERFEKVNGGVE